MCGPKMFENTTNFDFDDDVMLDTSFTPSVNSTHEGLQIRKSPSKELDGTSKNVKYGDHSITVLSKTEKAFENEICRNTLCFPNVRDVIESACPKQDTFISPNRVVKRKFPGPAGLLPETGAFNKSILQFLESEHFNNDDAKDLPVLSQQANLVFEDGPWKEMSKDFRVQSEVQSGEESLLEKFNIKWIKRQAMKHLLHHKAPFLAAVIQNLDIVDGKIPTINVLLKDCSGDIGGTILHSLYEDYSDFFRIGSVIVLKHFGVLSGGYNNHCLTITPNNLISIYCMERYPPNSNKGNVYSQNSMDAVRKIVIQDCNFDEIWKKYNEDVTTYSQETLKKVNLGNLRRTCSSEAGCLSSSFKNNFPVKKPMPMSPLGNHINSSSDVNTTIITWSRRNADYIPEKPISIDSNEDAKHSSPMKKKFNFKPRDVTTRKTDVNNENVNFNDMRGTQEMNDCDKIVISSSQISVKPDSKEHTEIWKNLLQDVDADSLFDDF